MKRISRVLGTFFCGIIVCHGGADWTTYATTPETTCPSGLAKLSSAKAAFEAHKGLRHIALDSQQLNQLLRNIQTALLIVDQPTRKLAARLTGEEAPPSHWQDLRDIHEAYKIHAYSERFQRELFETDDPLRDSWVSWYRTIQTTFVESLMAVEPSQALTLIQVSTIKQLAGSQPWKDADRSSSRLVKSAETDMVPEIREVADKVAKVRDNAKAPDSNMTIRVVPVKKGARMRPRASSKMNSPAKSPSPDNTGAEALIYSRDHPLARFERLAVPYHMWKVRLSKNDPNGENYKDWNDFFTRVEALLVNLKTYYEGNIEGVYSEERALFSRFARGLDYLWQDSNLMTILDLLQVPSVVRSEDDSSGQEFVKEHDDLIRRKVEIPYLIEWFKERAAEEDKS